MKNSIKYLLLFICFQSNAQEGFIKAYNFDYPTAVRFAEMILDDSEVVACGFINDSVPPYQSGIFISKIDTLGNVLNFNTYYDTIGHNYSAGEYSGGLIKLADNSGYLFTGSVFEGSDGFLSKWDLEGNVVWVKRLEDNTTVQGYYHLLVETESGFLIGGHKSTAAGGFSDIFLIKTDKEGNVQWERRYGEVPERDLLNSLLKINENEFVLAGAFGDSGTGTAEVQLFFVDSLGEVQNYLKSYTPHLPPIYENQSCTGLHRDGEGKWVYAMERMESQGPGGGFYTQTKFVVRDSNFDLILERTYDDIDGQNNTFHNLIPLRDGDWLGVGVNRELVDQPSHIASHNYGWMNRISNGEDGITELGDSLWTRLDLVFPDSLFPQGQYLHSAVELVSGNIIVAGYFNNLGIRPDRGILLKVNQHGCMDFDDCTPTNFPNISSTKKYQPSIDVNIYPNPVRRKLHVESETSVVWDKLELLDINGQAIWTEKYNNTLTMGDLPAGVYILRLWKEGRFWTRKVVKQ
ncbi:MAG: T9SS type A sorting domain-containing protein [Saprospiraceae bacterium]